MTRKSVIARNEHRIYKVKLLGPKRDDLRRQIKRKDISLQERFALQDKLKRMPRDSSKIRVRNRCMVTGRGRWFIKQYGISRIVFAELAKSGKLPGVVAR